MKRSRANIVKMFPQKQLVELTYCDAVVVPDISSGVYQFALNSVYDPDQSGVGHQPRGHDQWSTMYKRYCVIGAKVLVEPIQTPSNTDVDATLFGYVDDDSTNDAYTIEQLRELNMPHTTHKYVSLGESHRGIKSMRSPNLNFKINMKKFFGISKQTQILTPAAIGQGDLNPVPSALNPYGS